MKTSQAWSMDVMIGFVIFLGAIFLYYSIFNESSTSKTEVLEKDAMIVLENIVSDDSDVSVTEGGVVSQTKLDNLLAQDYNDIKKKMRIKNDFCMFLEDEDGNVIYLSPTQPGIGSDKINISNVPCG